MLLLGFTGIEISTYVYKQQKKNYDKYSFYIFS